MRRHYLTESAPTLVLLPCCAGAMTEPAIVDVSAGDMVLAKFEFKSGENEFCACSFV